MLPQTSFALDGNTVRDLVARGRYPHQTLFRNTDTADLATIVTVLHDLPQAGRFADRLIVLQSGRLISEGSPWDVLTPAMVRAVLGLDRLIIADPVAGPPLLIPFSATRTDTGPGGPSVTPPGRDA